MESRYIALLVGGAVIAGPFGACTRVDVADRSPSVDLGDGGVAGESTGGSGSLAGDGGDGRGGEHTSAGGAPGTIELGVWPTFAADPNEQRDAQAVLAAVSTLSIGATSLPLSERWDELSGATGSPRTVTWNRLDAMTQPFRDRGGSLALCIGIVDRTARAWPFAGELDSPGATSAIDRTIDEAYLRYGAHLSHLCFGYELDRYLSVATPGEQARLLELLKHAVDYASHHSMRVKTAIGTAVSLRALVEPTSVALDQVLLGDEVVAVSDPLDPTGALKSPESGADELTAALETLATLPGPRLPLTLFEVGYPSSTEVGSSEQAQLSYYTALFGLLDTRRDDVGFVGVYGLDDRAAADCEAEALSFGDVGAGSEPGGALAARALTRCSMGLRAEKDKLAWRPVSAALSRYR